MRTHRRGRLKGKRVRLMSWSAIAALQEAGLEIVGQKSPTQRDVLKRACIAAVRFAQYRPSGRST
ncbi:hypothetical protein BN2476_2120011 [Paraburkholderia piptadeniae]|uniref:Uncharacterized protein n=1 Tax=Paraburkholderia piptadeniae TaxID=1701573 RepID=A0A1N7SXG8_9BURK|nr:hypothetical protein BN2476_2120011 [Paraburkholderia piptadeniae]